MINNEARNIAKAESLCKSWNDHDPDGFAGHFAEDGVWLLARGAPSDGFTVRGREAVRDMYRHFCDTIPDITAKCDVTGRMAAIVRVPNGTSPAPWRTERSSTGLA